MTTTYIASDNTATNGTALGSGSDDVRVFRILIGAPTDGSTLTVYSISNPLNGSTANIAFKLTQPTAAAGKDWVRVIDFGSIGLPLGEGGNVIINGTNNVTVIWGLSDPVN